MSFLSKIHIVTKNGYTNKQQSSGETFAKNSDNYGPDYYLFTGDTIFVNGVGRPDLRNKSQEYTNKLLHTYYNVIFNLPEKTIILPAHYSSGFEHKKPVLDSLGSIKQKLASILGS